MSKTKVSILVALVLLTIAVSFIGPVKSQVEEVSIRFSGHVTGDCLIVYGAPIAGPWPNPIEWSGSAKGTAEIRGYAESVLRQYMGSFGKTYGSENLEANGHVNLRWTEGENNHNLLILDLYSTEFTMGFFAPDVDYFSVPVGGVPPINALRFDGKFVSGSIVQRIEGLGLFATFLLPLSGPGVPPVPGIFTILLFDETTQRMYTLIWASQDTEIPIGLGGPTVLVPAAKVFKSKVDIVG